MGDVVVGEDGVFISGRLIGLGVMKIGIVLGIVVVEVVFYWVD